MSTCSFPAENRILQWELVSQRLCIGAKQERAGNAERTVTRAQPNLDRAPGEMWLVAHSELHTSRRIRCVLDFLTRELAYLQIDSELLPSKEADCRQ
jgi:hypothetical protein